MLSYSETTDASYRIQFDPMEEYQYFCYLAPGEQVLLAPNEELNEEMDTVEDEDECEEAAMDEEGDEEMEVREFDGGERDAKRQKVEGFSVTDI